MRVQPCTHAQMSTGGTRTYLLAHCRRPPPALLGRQQEFDRYRSPSRKQNSVDKKREMFRNGVLRPRMLFLSGRRLGKHSPVGRRRIYSLISPLVIASQEIPPLLGIRPGKSASRQESADLPHSAQSLFHRTCHGDAVGRTVLPGGQGFRWTLELRRDGSHIRELCKTQGRATHRGRPYGGKFMRRRRSWKHVAHGQFPGRSSVAYELLRGPDVHNP